MVTAVLSVLMMGMIPAWELPETAAVPTDHLSIALPAPSKGSTLLAGIGKGMTASGVLVVDLQSAQQLYGRSVDKRRSVGSLAKLMTAVLIVEKHSLDEVVAVPKAATTLDGDHYLTAGDHFTVGDLLSALLISSSNDAAYALAAFDSGTIPAFAEKMNQRARALGLQDTSFQNPIGFDDKDQWSTPRDVAWLAAFALRFPEIRARMSMSDAKIESNEGRTVALSHTHALLHKHTAVVAGKTGTTLGAGECLVSVVQEHGREYLVVLLNSAARYVDMQVVLRALDDLRA